MNKILELKNISKKFNTINGEIEAIKDISLTINDGEFVALVGPSGCGKSTLLSIMSGLEKESTGNIEFSINNPTIGYMLQEDALFEHMKIKDNILLGLKVKKKLNTENIQYTMDLLKKYELDSFQNKRPSELSGGMKQRIALIRTLAIKPDVLFLDEPFSALDFSTRLLVSDDVYKIIKETKVTTVMVTHDIGEAIKIINITKKRRTLHSS